MVRGMPGGGQHPEGQAAHGADVPLVQGIALGGKVDGLPGRDPVGGARPPGQGEPAADVIVVDVGLEHQGDPHAEAGRRGQVRGRVALSIDNGAHPPVMDQVAAVAQPGGVVDYDVEPIGPGHHGTHSASWPARGADVNQPHVPMASSPAPAPFLAHGMGLAAVPPDWPPLRTAEVRRLLGRLPDVGDPSAASITWHSPRPFAATAVISVPGTAGHERRRFVAKRHHGAVRTATSLEAEHRFMRHLEAHGIAVPKALDDGACSAWTEAGFVYEVLEMLDGQDLYRDAMSWTPFVSVSHGEAAGRALARLHLAAETYTAGARPLEPLRASQDIISSADPVATAAALAEQRPGLADFLRQYPWRQELSTSLGSLQARFLPYAGALAPLWAHNDWHPSNLLWSGGGAQAQVAGTIDFGLSNLTTACYDLATALSAQRSAGWNQWTVAPCARTSSRPCSTVIPPSAPSGPKNRPRSPISCPSSTSTMPSRRSSTSTPSWAPRPTPSSPTGTTCSATWNGSPARRVAGFARTSRRSWLRPKVLAQAR